MCLLVYVPLLLQSSRLLWLSLVPCSASLGKNFIGKLILKILCWWICLTFWVFIRSICALVVWDFSYVMVVVCCLIFIIVLVVIVGRNMGLLFKLAEERLTKAQIELKHTFTLAVVKKLLTEVEQFLWAGHEMDPTFSFTWAAQFVVSPPLSHGVLMLTC